MALVLDETFATAISTNFATARVQSGALTATYNASAQAVDLSNSTAGQNIWDITAVPPTGAGGMGGGAPPPRRYHKELKLLG